ncbi:LamG domain-containing protein [Flaviaesturariibacter aridisoli]|uniref:LamG domain-containing protein n=1 Tax=Flaviaesturariibacter aridisoli TaxID=2545761 RepID=A0A4R4E4A8_9BACT|nr:LamG domain-containing protein [Flaviaesturariibacter aridisoli]TCZ74424.1 LamG domain-containing protein [Flaviaesturariibacter aridisoli]
MHPTRSLFCKPAVLMASLLALTGISSAFSLTGNLPAPSRPVPAPKPRTAASLQPDGLWASFSFDRDGRDETGQGHDLRLAEGAALITTAHCNGQSLALDGKTAFAVIDSGRVFPPGSFAISFSIQAHNTLQGRIFNRANYGTAKGASLTLGFEPVFGKRLCFGVSSERNVCDAYSDLYNTNALLSKKEIPADEWHDVVVQAGQNVQSVYIDGVLSTQQHIGTADFSVCPDAPFYFGKWWDLDRRSFDGLLDNIRIYTRLLSAEEIESLARTNRGAAAIVAVR